MTMMPSNDRQPSDRYAVELIKAGFAQCRYIVSEGSQPAICCGAPTDGGSWCKWHRQIVFEAARPKIRPYQPAA